MYSGASVNIFSQEGDPQHVSFSEDSEYMQQDESLIYDYEEVDDQQSVATGTDADQNLLSNEQLEDGELNGMPEHDIFDVYFNKIEGIFLNAAQIMNAYSEKIQEMQIDIDDLNEELSIEHKELQTKKRGTLDVVDCFKLVSFTVEQYY